MKKILAVALTVLMLLPVMATIALAAITIPEGTEVRNVAGNATVSVEDPNGLGIDVGSEFVGSALVDGDKSTGTKSPKGLNYSYVLTYDEVYYFTEIVVACNGSGSLASGGSVNSDTYNVKGLVIKVYSGKDLVYESEQLDVSNKKEISVKPEVKGDKVEVFKYNGKGGRTEYMWEIETYAPNMEICSAQVENVAAEATFSATGANANYWWAMDYNTWVDGDPLTGSHSPKGRNYSVWMHFKQEYLFSQIDLVCNTEGGAKLASGATLDERYFGNAMMRVLVYNYNEDLVWDSDFIDTSTITTLTVDPYVMGAVIEIRFYNGNFGGGEYMYEVSAYAQSGDHVFTPTNEENPTCLLPGYRELTCHCGKVIKEVLNATGFHKWGEGVVTTVPTETDNGVLTVPCTGCTSTKLYDIASLDHNWGKGVVYAPSCEKDGYTLYKCADAGCNLEYKADYVDGYSHKWDDGATTKKPTVEEEGQFTYTCTICGEQKHSKLRKHKYTDNTAPFSKDDIESYYVYINKSDSQYNEGSYVGSNTNPENLFDGDVMTWWYGPSGSYVEVTLKKDFIFTSGKFYATSNWSQMQIEFYDADGNLTCKYNTGNVNNGTDQSNPDECDMLDALGGGTKARKIRIISVNPKWGNGEACSLQELALVSHECVLTEADYILSGSSYVAPTCLKDGKCKAVCQVCLCEDTIVLKATPNLGHSYSSEVIVDKAPECLNDGYGHATCTLCNKTIEGISIPATGKHDFSKTELYVSAKCGFAGVEHIVCKYCNTLGSTREIAPTGIHVYEWTTKSHASYTAVGVTEHCCIYCDVIDTASNSVKEEPKLEVPADLLTFVGVTAGTDGKRNTLTFKYKLALDYLPELEQTCDIRVITTIQDELGRVASVESYGKYATNSYDEATGEFTVTIYPATTGESFGVSTAVRIMNFRGIVYKVYQEDFYSVDMAK